MANAPSPAALVGNIRRQLREIAEYRRDSVSLRPVEWDMVCEALAPSPPRPYYGACRQFADAPGFVGCSKPDCPRGGR